KNCRACNRYSGNARDKRACLVSSRPDADGASLGRNTEGADIDVVIAGGEIAAGITANGDVAIPGIITERLETLGRVVVANRVINERINTVGCVVDAGGVASERTDACG